MAETLDFDSFVLAASTANITDEPAAREHADAIEFRLDLADEPLSALADYDGELPIIATNRASWEGGEWTGTDEARLDALESATEFERVRAIDVELASVDGGADRLVETARERDVAVIVSVHDFETTPPPSEMVRTLADASEHGDVAKLAVTANAPADALALLSATERCWTRGHRVATMAMGEVGRHTRAVAPIYGSVLGYAPVQPDDATAPGQYDLETLSALIESLREA
ncbi:type I 3-dehydroquinate dehydratase [Halovivax gelatinilyticus]|uniref:type I 3-dehydroquinate dehydratase n=1 Tax=Halovivax gelatinilyticus TaxID=2961597 RepID=UPI0020CA76B4|nr:type I 3-dehydroquinate dehydratase [Halovivax gelatinilyticus]